MLCNLNKKNILNYLNIISDLLYKTVYKRVGLLTAKKNRDDFVLFHI